VDLDDVVVVAVEPPHRSQQLALRQDESGVAYQRREQCELGGGEIERSAGAAGDVRVLVDDLLVDLAANLTDLTAPLVAEIDAPHRERPPLVHTAR